MTRKHYVMFMSPGAFVGELTDREIGEWDTVAAMRMATEIREQHNATPYGFWFETRIVHDPIPDGEGGTLRVEPKLTAKSGTYYINGTVKRYDDIPGDKEKNIRRSNMRYYNWPFVVESREGFKWTASFGESDAVVNADGIVTARGDEPAFVEYRRNTIAAWARVEVMR